jgi:hypothetical protein
MAYWSPLFFPFEIPEVEDAPSADLGAIVTIEQIHKWCFQVKKWRATFQNPAPAEGEPLPDPIVIENIGAYNAVFGDFDSAFLVNDTEPILPDERYFDLVKDYVWVTLVGTSAHGVFIGTSSSYTYLPFLGCSGAFGGAGFCKHGSDYYFIPFKGGDGTGNSQITIDGVTLGGPNDHEEIYNSLVLEPTAFWEHDPGSGGPVYDSETGALLRDPFSIQSAG